MAKYKTTIPPNAALIAAIVTFCLIAMGFVFVELYSWINDGQTSLEERRFRSELARNFTLFFLAVVGIGLAIWRSLTAQQNLEATQNQLNELRSNNLALQLQKGAELIADPDPAKAEAGIATLESVGTDKEKRFATQAANLLASFIQQRFADHHNDEHHICPSAANALASCGDHEAKSSRHLYFEAKEKDAIWINIYGAQRCSYKYGRFIGDVFGEKFGINYNFDQVSFVSCVISCKHIFNYCNFLACNIRIIRINVINSSVFRQCDFSGCKIVGPGRIDGNKLNMERCTFDADNPPKHADGSEPTVFLAQLTPKTNNTDD